MADNQELNDVKLANSEDYLHTKPKNNNDYDLFDKHHYLMVFPKKVEKDLSRTINALGFVDNELPSENNSLDIDNEIKENEKEILDLNKQIEDLKDSYKDVIDSLSYNLSLRKEAENYENSLAIGDKYFYFSALVPENDINNVENLEKKYPDTKIITEDLKVEKKKKSKKDKDKPKNINEESYLLVYPKKVKKDVSRSINTLGFVDNDIPDNLNSSNIDREYIKVNDELTSLHRQINTINSQYEDTINNLSYSLDHAKKSEELKSNMAQGDKYFYLSGWVPESEVDKFKTLEDKYDNTILSPKDDQSVNQQPPTRLKNNKVFKPFEYLVNMYGAPSYDEVDPTPFFAITYMLLYGLMFGDLGQGLVFLALGFYISKKNKTYGALLKRIGISASVFGLMYGSFFGKEDLIPTLLIKPFDNVMTVLIASVVFGISLMVISYIIGIYNKVSKQ
ncbi:MAG: V-type ATPase 116kDa subunit family protein, partial [Anaerococcus sp.]|nr:V-type ATPase 116kDa subunit family protein [Anaerococcus sp.]